MIRILDFLANWGEIVYENRREYLKDVLQYKGVTLEDKPEDRK